MHTKLTANRELKRLRCIVDGRIILKKMTVFWVVAPCDLVEVYRLFRGAYYLHPRGDNTAQQPRRRPSIKLAAVRP
jgi:hypothetical protein